jgi:SAM-dependent methyltransferase
VEAAVYQLFREGYETNWYLSAREDVIDAFVRRFCPPGPGDVVVDVGGGTGRILARVAGSARALAVEEDESLVSHGRARYGVRFVRANASSGLPLRTGSASLVLLLDVLEHVDDDAALLGDVRRVLRPGGRALVTVPAFRMLWSRHDEQHHHRRRYEKHGLRQVIGRAGLECVHLTFYNSLLFPMILAARALDRVTPGRSGTDYERPPRPVRSVLSWTFRQERRLVTRWRLPVGVSLLALVRSAPARQP